MRYLSPFVHQTPVIESQTFDMLTGAHLHFKMENLQRTGSFKLRGALNKILHLTKEQAERGIVAASAGNHAQGVALSASKRHIKAKIFMPVATPKAKVQATEAYGAEVVLAGDSYQESYEAAVQSRELSGATFVHAFDDVDVMAGQGTVAVELLQQCPDVEVVFVPIGGGGLAAGVATYLKNVNPNIRVIGVQSEFAPSMYNRFYDQGPFRLQNVHGIAEGILVKEAGMKTFPIIRQYVDEIITVSDKDIARAIILMLERSKFFVEGAGAAAFAAALSGRVAIEGKKVGIIVSGGNADLENLPVFKKIAGAARAAETSETGRGGAFN
ncbi:threonine ammonia-lyase [Sporolactobacillus sp. THM7-7]|nr:threonine ammonia-lyase [Sporolactobacillus sp. THM7-7]